MTASGRNSLVYHKKSHDFQPRPPTRPSTTDSHLGIKLIIGFTGDSAHKCVNLYWFHGVRIQNPFAHKAHSWVRRDFPRCQAQFIDSLHCTVICRISELWLAWALEDVVLPSPQQSWIKFHEKQLDAYVISVWLVDVGGFITYQFEQFYTLYINHRNDGISVNSQT